MSDEQQKSDARTPIEVCSPGLIPKGGRAQLYYRIPDDTRFVGFEVEETTHVPTVMVGSTIVTVAEGGTWADAIGQGFDLGAGQYVTVMAENRADESKPLRAALLFVGGNHEKPATIPTPQIQSVSPTATAPHPFMPVPRTESRPEPALDAPTTVVVSRLQADSIRKLVEFGLKVPTRDVPGISGRIRAALLSAGQELGPTGALVQIAMTVATACALGDAVRRSTPLMSEQRAEILRGFESGRQTVNDPPEVTTRTP